MGDSRFCCKGRRAYGPHYSFTRGYGALHSPSDFLMVEVDVVTAAAVSVNIVMVSVVVVNVRSGVGVVRNK